MGQSTGRRKLLILGLLGAVLLGLTLLLAIRQLREVARREASRTYPEDGATVSELRLARLGDTLLLQREASGWSIPSLGMADTLRINTLLDLLGSVVPDLPVSLDGPLPPTAQPLDSALSVELRGPGHAPIAYRAIYYDSEHLALRFPGGESYRALLLGYRPEVLRHLSLRAPLWVDPSVGLARPSELASLRVLWAQHPDDGFAIRLDDDLRAILSPADAPAQHLAYDTARVASFLHSLTELRYQPSPDAPEPRPEGLSPFFELRYTLRSGQERHYRLYPIAGDDNHAILELSGHEPQRVSLAQWGATMVTLRDLATTAPSGRGEP
ncbi:MAG: hypothetical protein CSA07_03365 [Bacteroidia bacterium]|nr:MAG: hypothetical protein CSA07_03365 [Bacteroidia bacterium]